MPKLRKTEKMRHSKGPVVGEFEQPPELNPDVEERHDALPEQEAFWKDLSTLQKDLRNCARLLAEIAQVENLAGLTLD